MLTTTSFNDFITSAFESAFDTLYDLLLAFVDFFAGIPKMVLHMVKGISEALGGLGKFIASNIVVIAIIAVSAYGYLEYQRRQGRQIKVEDKRMN